MSGDFVVAGLDARRGRRRFDSGGQNSLNRLAGLLLHGDQVRVVTVSLVAQAMLGLELRESEGRMHFGGLQVAAVLSHESKAKASRALGPERGFHLNAMPEEVLGQFGDRLAALDGRGDDGIEGGVEVGDLDFRGRN